MELMGLVLIGGGGGGGELNKVIPAHVKVAATVTTLLCINHTNCLSLV